MLLVVIDAAVVKFVIIAKSVITVTKAKSYFVLAFEQTFIFIYFIRSLNCLVHSQAWVWPGSFIKLFAY